MSVCQDSVKWKAAERPPWFICCMADSDIVTAPHDDKTYTGDAADIESAGDLPCLNDDILE